MKITKKTIEVVELDMDDVFTLTHMINYTIHRLKKHKKIIPFLHLEDVERMKEQLNNLK
jgi:hypothetical protein